MNAWWINTAWPALKGAFKSWQVWFSLLLAALPDILVMLQTNFAALSPYIPEAQQPTALRLIALAILLLRIKTTTSLVDKGAPK